MLLAPSSVAIPINAHASYTQQICLETWGMSAIVIQYNLAIYLVQGPDLNNSQQPSRPCIMVTVDRMSY